MSAKEELIEFLLNMTPQQIEDCISKYTNEEWLATQSDEDIKNLPSLVQLLRSIQQGVNMMELAMMYEQLSNENKAYIFNLAISLLEAQAGLTPPQPSDKIQLWRDAP